MIGIIGAMQTEVDLLISKIEDANNFILKIKFFENFFSIFYHVGTLFAKRVANNNTLTQKIKMKGYKNGICKK